MVDNFLELNLSNRVELEFAIDSIFNQLRAVYLIIDRDSSLLIKRDFEFEEMLRDYHLNLKRLERIQKEVTIYQECGYFVSAMSYYRPLLYTKKFDALSNEVLSIILAIYRLNQKLNLRLKRRVLITKSFINNFIYSLNPIKIKGNEEFVALIFEALYIK